MRIIVANYRYFIAGGPERYMFKFMEAAKERGVEVIPFSIANPQNEKSEYSKYFAKPRARELLYSDTKKTFSNMLGMIRATTWNFDAERRLRKLIQDTRPDVVYILHEVNHLSPSIIYAAKKEGVRVVHRISDFFMFCPKYDFLCGNEICEACMHGNFSKAIKQKCVKGSKFGTILRIAGMKIYKLTKVFDDVDHFVCTCEFTKKKLVDGGIASEKISVIPTFIDATHITPCYEHDNYFLFLGRMAHQKGTIYAIEAMKYLKDTSYVLKITGTPSKSEEDQSIVRYINENGLKDKIVFTGFKKGKELDELIDRCTAVVCPAIWYENMPNTVIESYAHGKPVIASRVGSFVDLVDDNNTGYLFELKNSEDCANKMKKLIDNSISVEMGLKARERCLKLYDIDKHMDKLFHLFE